MRVDARIENDGRIALFFPDDRDEAKNVACFAFGDGHGYASRSYMRDCKKPSTPEEIEAAFKVLRSYFNAYA